MRVVIYILIFISVVLIIYNITLLNLSDLFEGESAVAAIGILSASCAIVLLLILLASKKISNRKK